MINRAEFNRRAENVLAKVVDAIRWVGPGTIVAHKQDVGQIHFHVGWFGERVLDTVYFTPLGEIPHHIPEMTAYSILHHADDWVDALVLVHQIEQECAC